MQTQSRHIVLTATTIVLIWVSTTRAQTASFPGAYGFGAQATGGRGGTVYHVTNLNDSGPGSFRDAVSQGNRTVVFDVGGYVQLQSAVPVASDTTIAGQTAPGGGIGAMGAEVSLSNHTNIIFRNFRFKERWGLEFRTSFFNAFNHPNFAEPSPDLSTQITASADDGSFDSHFGVGGPRNIQFMLRLSF